MSDRLINRNNTEMARSVSWLPDACQRARYPLFMRRFDCWPNANDANRSFLPASREAAMATTITDTTRIGRCLIFVREHLEQARAADDQIRAMQWDAVMDQFIDAWPRQQSA